MTQKKIGIDLDNTIINYENSFKKYLKDQNIYLRKVDKNKVKNLIKKNLKIKNWTESQEEIYGKYIKFAKPYTYFKFFENFVLKNNFKLYIISHKTKNNEFSKKYNLHKISIKWIKKNFNVKNYKIFFLNTVDKKIDKINKINPDYFIDDLSQILLDKKLSKKINKIYFSKYKNDKIKNYVSWDKITKYIKKNENIE